MYSRIHLIHSADLGSAVRCYKLCEVGGNSASFVARRDLRSAYLRAVGLLEALASPLRGELPLRWALLGPTCLFLLTLVVFDSCSSNSWSSSGSLSSTFDRLAVA